MSSKIRQFFESRYQPNGYLISVDYSQLEVVVLAFLSKDKQMRQDILDGIDFHALSASWVHGVPYQSVMAALNSNDKAHRDRWKEYRRLAKTPRFELQYGAGPYTIAKNNNWSQSKARNYINRYYNRYPRVKEWQEEVTTYLNTLKFPTGEKDDNGIPILESYYDCEYSHRRYNIRAKNYKTLDWKTLKEFIQTKFLPTQTKNYPVQGLATADIVPTVLGELYLNLIEQPDLEDTLLVNTVHDSIILDTTEKELDRALELVYTIVVNTENILKERLKFEFDLPLEFKLEVGRNWLDMKEINIEDYIT